MMIIYRAIGILALTTTVVAANHHQNHPQSTATDHHNHPNLRTYQNTTSSAQAAFGKGSSDDSCEDPEVYCGMTIPAGKALTLEKDLVCTQATGDPSDSNVAITLEEGATLDCGGNSIVQLNDEIAKATKFDCMFGRNPVSYGPCGLSWGAIGVLLKSGASVKNCIVSGWQRGFAIAPGVNGDDDEIKMETCEATLNHHGLSVELIDYGYVVNYSVKKSRFHHNHAGVFLPEQGTLPTSKVNIEDVQSNFNIGSGFFFQQNSHTESEITISNVEASYNVADGVRFQVGPKLILKGDNSFNKNSRHGFESSANEVIVAKGGALNALNNSRYGVSMFASSTTLTVQKGGEVNACGNQQFDIHGFRDETLEFFPASGKGFTCNTENEADGFECRNECPVCDATV